MNILEKVKNQSPPPRLCELLSGSSDAENGWLDKDARSVFVSAAFSRLPNRGETAEIEGWIASLFPKVSRVVLQPRVAPTAASVFDGAPVYTYDDSDAPPENDNAYSSYDDRDDGYSTDGGADGGGSDGYAALQAENNRELMAGYAAAQSKLEEARKNGNILEAKTEEKRWQKGGFPPKKEAAFAKGPPPAKSASLKRRERWSFDTSAPEFIHGKEFDLSAVTPISQAVEAPTPHVALAGVIFSYEKKQGRRGASDKIIVKITDGTSSTEIIYPDNKKIPELKEGEVIAVTGRFPHDEFTGERFIEPSSIAKIKRLRRRDNYDGQRRVELHMHSAMSQMDALTQPGDIIKTASEWGWEAIALTDHGNVQGFPEAMLQAEKLAKDGKPIKVIYGMEGYFVDDTAKAYFGGDATPLDGDFIVFDIETTGLSAAKDAITEIGAVRISGGEIVNTFQTFVDPGRPIPQNIVALTHITDQMVAGAPCEFDAVEAFLAFADGDVLVAHNANFDIGFISRVCRDNKRPFKNGYLDTLSLARFLFPKLPNHKLDTVAKEVGAGAFNHHRADADAAVLAEIFLKMVDRLKSSGITDTVSLNNYAGADPLKLYTYHIILLVKNLTGLKNLYKIISQSYLNYYYKHPRIPKTVLDAHREGLIIGSACEAGQLFSAMVDGKSDGELRKIASYYDYLEIQPISNNQFLIDNNRVRDTDELKDLNLRVVEMAEKLGKPIIATCDAHYIDPDEAAFRTILQAGMKFSDADKETKLHLRTTEEMLAEFAYLGKNKAFEAVVTNPSKIAAEVEVIRPIPTGTYTPKIDGAEDELRSLCYTRMTALYGDPNDSGRLPELIAARLARELDSIIANGFAVLYIIAQKLVKKSEELGYLVGSRGSVGSSFVAFASGISEVNPLPAHYICPNCRHSDFEVTADSGFDLPDKLCPHCGTKLRGDGHNIPFETFLGFKGDKSPDIDLNFSGEVQGRIHKYTEELFGAENVFRAGTLGTIADKTAYGFVKKYVEERALTIPKAEEDRLTKGCVGVKRTTGQHPGGIIVIPKEYDVHDFTPLQHPADAADSDIVTTHFAFIYLHDTILKLDELGHDIPTKYKMLEKYTGTSVMDVPMNDPEIYKLFSGVSSLGLRPGDIECALGTLALPEFGTNFVVRMLQDAKPKNFADLLQVSGLSHGTDVWAGNADELIKSGECTVATVIGTRDSIMLTLIEYGMEKGLAFKITESVRKGKGLTKEWEEAMTASGVPAWYIDSCKKIKYMFPKAHAAAYVMTAIRLGWYKINYPMEFYAAYFTVAPGGVDAAIVAKGRGAVRAKITELDAKVKDRSATQKDQEALGALQLINESMARGVKYLPVDLYKSAASEFLPENGAIRLPFAALSGLGENAAARIIEARGSTSDLTREEVKNSAALNTAVMKALDENHVFDNVAASPQVSLF